MDSDRERAALDFDSRDVDVVDSRICLCYKGMVWSSTHGGTPYGHSAREGTPPEPMSPAMVRIEPPAAGLSSAAVWLIALLMLASPAVARDTAYTVAGTELYLLDLETGELTPEGDLGVTGIQVLARDPSGTLFAATRDELYTIDPQIPEATPIGPTGLSSSARLDGMTFDAEGRLWLLVGGRLNEVDPSTGAVTPVVNVEQGLLALAADGLELYGVRIGLNPPPEGPIPPPLAVRIDRATGAVEVLAPLDDLFGPSGGVADMDFDGRGQAWILTIIVLPGIPPDAFHRVFRAVEFETGQLELVSEGIEPGVSILLNSMALTRDRAVVEIPALNPHGLVLLSVVLAASALWILRARFRVPPV